MGSRTDREPGRSPAGHRHDDGDRLPDDLIQADGSCIEDRLVVLQDEARDVLAGCGAVGNGNGERAMGRVARRELQHVGRVVDPAGCAGLGLVTKPASEAAVDDRVDVRCVRRGCDRGSPSLAMTTLKVRVSPGFMVRSKYDPGWPTGSKASFNGLSLASAAAGAHEGGAQCDQRDDRQPHVQQTAGMSRWTHVTEPR